VSVRIFLNLVDDVVVALCFPALRFRSSVSVSVTVSIIRVRTAIRTEKIELDPIRTDQRKRQTYGNGERYFFT